MNSYTVAYGFLAIVFFAAFAVFAFLGNNIATILFLVLASIWAAVCGYSWSIGWRV